MVINKSMVKIIAYLIWKGSYNLSATAVKLPSIIAYLIWKGSYNLLWRAN